MSNVLLEQFFQDPTIARAKYANDCVTTHQNGEAIRTDAVSICSALVLKLRKPDGHTEITLFHLSPDGVRGEAEKKMHEIAAEAGEKTAVFVTNAESVGNINARDPQATAQTKNLLSIVPDVKVLPTITTGEDSAMSVGYLPRADEVVVWSYRSRDITVHKPFSQQQGQGQGQGSGQSK